MLMYIIISLYIGLMLVNLHKQTVKVKILHYERKMKMKKI